MVPIFPGAAADDALVAVAASQRPEQVRAYLHEAASAEVHPPHRLGGTPRAEALVQAAGQHVPVLGRVAAYLLAPRLALDLHRCRAALRCFVWTLKAYHHHNASHLISVHEVELYAV